MNFTDDSMWMQIECMSVWVDLGLLATAENPALNVNQIQGLEGMAWCSGSQSEIR